MRRFGTVQLRYEPLIRRTHTSLSAVIKTEDCFFRKGLWFIPRGRAVWMTGCWAVLPRALLPPDWLQCTILCRWCKTVCLRTVTMACSGQTFQFCCIFLSFLPHFHWCWVRRDRQMNLWGKWRGEFCTILHERSLVWSHLQAKCINNVSNWKWQWFSLSALSVLSNQLKVKKKKKKWWQI